MKRVTAYVIGLVAAVGLSAGALANDLEVTMEVVPADAAARAATGEIKLPADAAPEAHENAAFGLDTANRARAREQGGGELGEQFGQDVSAAARERAHERIPNIVPPGRP